MSMLNMADKLFLVSSSRRHVRHKCSPSDTKCNTVINAYCLLLLLVILAQHNSYVTCSFQPMRIVPTNRTTILPKAHQAKSPPQAQHQQYFHVNHISNSQQKSPSYAKHSPEPMLAAASSTHLHKSKHHHHQKSPVTETSIMYMHSANANFTVNSPNVHIAKHAKSLSAPAYNAPLATSRPPSIPQAKPVTIVHPVVSSSSSWEPVTPRPGLVKSVPVEASVLYSSSTNVKPVYTNQSLTLSSPSVDPAYQSTTQSKYKGLVEPAANFRTPLFFRPQALDMLLENDPFQSGPVLMDLMQLDNAEAEKLYPNNGLFEPFTSKFSQIGNAAEDFGHSTKNELIPVYQQLQNNYPELYDEGNTEEPKIKPTDPTYNMVESKAPVAQQMLFYKNNDYYMPFKVNSMNVYAKYLSRGQGKCPKYSSQSKLTVGDVQSAVKSATETVEWYESTITDNALDTKRREPYIPNGVLDSKVFEYASQYLKKKKCYNKMDVINVLPKVDVANIVSRYDMKACKQAARITCDSKARYRSIDGSCNNLKQKTWGKSFTCHRRLLPPDYADGVALPRVSYDGGKLPNARLLSSLLFPDIEVHDHKLTSMTMSFGQFVIHDITRTLPTANDIKCCPSKKAVHPECMAIDIVRQDDVLLRQFNQTCLNFVRSIVCNPCSLGPREQQNQATHTFDMSHMYGLRLNDSIALRTLRGGKLRSSFTSTYPKEELLPKMAKEDPGCNVRPKPPRFKCFESSDGIRASQHPALQALHVAFHRRHNMHADALAKVNPHWDDEKLYQEARRIMIAEESKIIYGEYLPAVFGKKLMKHFRLGINYKGYTKYDPKLNPATIQEFIVAAGRFGHSQINDQFRVLFADKKMSYSFSLRDNFFETTIVSLGHSGGILKGLAMDSTEASDPYFVDDIKNQLYHLRREKFGRDLPAFNIQRGRDHGIPGYIFYLDFCFGYKVKSWSDLVTFIPKKQLKKLQLFYKNWKDIDIFVGGVSERLIAGAAFGPTFACINGIQFYNFKYGDRFYFEHGYQSGSFTPAQLDNIKKTASLSSIICKTNNEIEKMPKNSFIKASPDYNPVKSCSSFPELNYLLWMDKKRVRKNGKKSAMHNMNKPVFVPKPLITYHGKYPMKRQLHYHPPMHYQHQQYHYQYPHYSKQPMMAMSLAEHQLMGSSFIRARHQLPPVPRRRPIRKLPPDDVRTNVIFH